MDDEAINVTASSDGFAAVFDLLHLVTDPKATGARLRSLQEHTAALTRAKAELAVSLQEHDRHIAETTAELAAEQKRIDEGWDQLKESKEKWTDRLEKAEAKITEIAQIEFARQYETLPGGLTRMRDHTADPIDAHFVKVPEGQFAKPEETPEIFNPRADVSGCAFPQGTTLTRGH